MKSQQLKSSSQTPQYEAPDTCVHTIECERIMIVTSNTETVRMIARIRIFSVKESVWIFLQIFPVRIPGPPVNPAGSYSCLSYCLPVSGPLANRIMIRPGGYHTGSFGSSRLWKFSCWWRCSYPDCWSSRHSSRSSSMRTGRHFCQNCSGLRHHRRPRLLQYSCNQTRVCPQPGSHRFSWSFGFLLVGRVSRCSHLC